jgi:hypothetical protein
VNQNNIKHLFISKLKNEEQKAGWLNSFINMTMFDDYEYSSKFSFDECLFCLTLISSKQIWFLGRKIFEWKFSHFKWIYLYEMFLFHKWFKTFSSKSKTKIWLKLSDNSSSLINCFFNEKSISSKIFDYLEILFGILFMLSMKYPKMFS